MRNYENINLTQIQKEVITGNLLGDGYLKCLKNANRQSRLSILQKQDFSEYVKGLQDIYLPFSSNYYEGKTKKPKRINGKVYHPLNSNEYCYRCGLDTIAHPIFTEYRKKWYKESYTKSSKIVPSDLLLTWRAAAIWMCDDGSNYSKLNCGRYLVLFTNCFTELEVEFLTDRLMKDLKVKSKIFFNYPKERKYPCIKISGDDWFNFIENIKPYIPWKCLQYKCFNRKALDQFHNERKPNISGHVGVYFYYKKWRAQIGVNGKSIHLGSYETKEEAIYARKSAELLHADGVIDKKKYVELTWQRRGGVD
jgi:hypothetical protein